MLSADIFLFVEKFLGGAASFFYSTIISVWLCIRYPVYAPKLLHRRLKDPAIQQVGPLTLAFAILSIAILPLALFIYGNSPTQILRGDNKLNFLSLLVATFVATLVVDAFTRLNLFIAMQPFWSRNGPVGRTVGLKSIHGYALIPPIALAVLLWSSVTWLSSLASAYINNEYWKATLNYPLYLLFYSRYTTIAILSLSISLALRYLFNNYLTILFRKRRESKHHFTAFLMLKESYFLVLISLTALSASCTRDLISTYYSDSEIVDYADKLDLDVVELTCKLEGASAEVFTRVLNRSKSKPALVSRNATIRFHLVDNFYVEMYEMEEKNRFAETLIVKAGDFVEFGIKKDLEPTLIENKDGNCYFDLIVYNPKNIFGYGGSIKKSSPLYDGDELFR